MHIKRKGNRVNVNSSSFNRKAAEESVYEYYEGIVIVGGGEIRMKVRGFRRGFPLCIHCMCYCRDIRIMNKAIGV